MRNRCWYMPQEPWHVLLPSWTNSPIDDKCNSIHTFVPSHCTKLCAMCPFEKFSIECFRPSNRIHLTSAASSSITWLQPTPPPVKPPFPQSVKFVRKPNSPFSTSHQPISLKRPRQHSYSPPDPIQSSVKTRGSPPKQGTSTSTSARNSGSSRNHRTTSKGVA